MKVSIRCQSLTMSALAAQEKHAKRLDRTSQLRVVRDVQPLVAGSLDLRESYDKHMDGVKLNAAAKKPALHFIMRFPPEALEQDFGHFSGEKLERQKMMLKQAVSFIQNTHGGDAVFAARIDRDETGETIVDVFAAPKYEKRTKKTKPDERGAIWSSASKFGKELAEKHGDEIKRRHPDARHGRLTGPRMVGIALNSEFRDFFEKTNKITLEAKVEKVSNHADRLEIEAYKRVRDKEDQVTERLDKRERLLKRLYKRVKGVAFSISALLELPEKNKLSEMVDDMEDAASVSLKPDDPFSDTSLEEPGQNSAPGM